MIREATAGDAEAIATIYAHYVEHTAITFDLEPLPASVWAERIAARADYPWLATEDGGELAGFAYGGAFRGKPAYRPTVETTIYLRDGAAGRGLGTALLGELLDRCEALGHHSAVAGITLPNDASVALHEKLGFAHVGTFAEVGRKFDRWHDVAFYLKRF